MKFQDNKPLRNLGVYKLRHETLIALIRSQKLAFLFSEAHWKLHGPVDYRVSHGGIYHHGVSTGLRDEDLLDTGMTVDAPALSILFEHNGH